MKKSKTVLPGDLPSKNYEEDLDRCQSSKLRFFKALKKHKIQKNIDPPNAPLNTSEYIMSQHPTVFYNPEELYGSFIGLTPVFKK